MSYKPPIILLAAIAALPPLAVDMYLPAIPAIAAQLGAEVATIQNSLSIFLLGFGLGMLLLGPLSDRFGRKPLALLGLSSFALTSFIVGNIHSTDVFMTARFFQGLLGSGASVVIPAIIRDCYGKDTAKGMSSVMMIMLLAPLLAPLLGSGVLHFLPWQFIFYSQAAYGVLLMALTVMFLKETHPGHEGPPPRLLTGFFRNYRIIFSHRRAWFDLFSSLLSALAFFTYLTSVSFIYITYFGVSETLFGVLFAFSAAALILANFVNVRAVGRMGPRRMLAAGLSLAISAAVLLLIFNLLELPVFFTVAGFVLLMGGLGLSSVNADSLVLMEFPKQASSASAVIGTLRFGSGSLAGPILAMLYTGTPLPALSLMLCAIVGAFSIQLLRYFLIGGKHTDRTRQET